MTVSGGEILLNLLQAYGVEYILCSPGTEWTPVWEALLKRYAQGDHTLKHTEKRASSI
jgi:thiamine pyrophosphate-dependent acetolactate synthase large subunit-like protein